MSELKIEETVINPNRWSYDKPDGTWNAKRAQEDIYHVLRFARFPASAIIIDQLYKSRPEFISVIKAAVEEMADVVNNKSNKLGYHLNHIVSGKTVYAVFDNSEGAYVSTSEDEYFTKEEAEEAAKGEENAKVEEADGKWIVMHFDEETSEDCWANGWGGTPVADFDDEDEAKEELSRYEHGYIQEFPSEEFYYVVSNENGKGLFKMAFPTESRALAFLYKAINPPCWTDYIDALNKILDEGEKAGVVNE